jgi:hypothetical protein
MFAFFDDHDFFSMTSWLFDMIERIVRAWILHVVDPDQLLAEHMYSKKPIPKPPTHAR